MTKKSHKRFAYPWAIAVILFMYPFWGLFASVSFFVAMVLGSTAPDYLEFGKIKHRTFTHLPWLWFFCYALGVSLTSHFNMGLVASCIVAGICLGAISHWVGDLGTPMGVPVLSSKKRYSLNMWKTGHVSEIKPIIMAWLAVIALAGFKVLHPNL